MSTQMALFDNLSASAFPVGNVRQKQIDAALRVARDVWREHYESFILEYAADATEPFTAEDVRERYRATPGRAQTDAEQASGGIFQRLLRQGKLVPVGIKRSKIYGNNLTTYRRGMSTAAAVEDLVQTAFEANGGTGDAGAVVLRGGR